MMTKTGSCLRKRPKLTCPHNTYLEHARLFRDGERCVSGRVCVCVCERERESERQGGGKGRWPSHRRPFKIDARIWDCSAVLLYTYLSPTKTPRGTDVVTSLPSNSKSQAFAASCAAVRTSWSTGNWARTRMRQAMPDASKSCFAKDRANYPSYSFVGIHAWRC